MQGLGCFGHRAVEMRARPAASASSLSATSEISAWGPLRPARVRAEKGWAGAGRRASVKRGAQLVPSGITQRFARRVKEAGSAPASAARSRIERVVAS
jgi:hypothetical protein